MAGARGRSTCAPATSSPRSRPTRRPWRWRRPRTAQLGKILVAEGTEHVPVNQPIALLLTDGEDAAEASSFETRPAAAPQDEAPASRTASAPHPEEGASAPVSKGEGAQAIEAISPSPQPSPQRGEGAARELGESLPDVERAPAGPQVAPAEPRPDAEIAPGTEMVRMTVREALRDAMAEEMRARSGGVRHGRGGRRVSGRL